MSDSTTDKPRTTLRDLAHERFMAQLYQGALRPSSLVSQRELCDLLDVPMGPVREALKRLEGEGVVTLIPQRGIRILEIDERTINNAFQMRLLIECEAVRQYIRYGDLSAVEDLKARTLATKDFELTGRSASIDEINQLTTLDHEMHLLFVSALDNDFATEIMERMLGRLRLSRLVFRLRNFTDGAALNEHLDLLDHVLDGNEDEAAASMKRHLEASWQRALGMPADTSSR